MSIADKLITIAENERRVYEAGKQAEYDAFWDNFQQNGTRISYPGGFGGRGWTKDTFKPKYPVSLKGTTVADYMFVFFNSISSADVDDLLDFTEFNSMFDFSGCKRLRYTFYNARIKNLYVDCSNATEMQRTFGADNGGYIDNLTLKVTETTTSFTAWFEYQQHIKNITFTEDSVVARNISFSHSSKLTIESVDSIINAAANGITITFHSNVVDRMTAEQWLMVDNKNITIA